MANFDAQIQSLVGTADQTEMDTWASEAVVELTNLFPPKLKQKCATLTELTSSTPMDLDGVGDILYVTRENANSGHQVQCRAISPLYGGLADDSSSIHYATATDPVYWLESRSDASKLIVKPDPSSAQTANVYHIEYTSVNVSDTDTIANFPDEAEYLIVLYVGVKVLQNKMNEMQASIIHSDQDGSYTASSGSSQGWEKVRDWLESEEDSEMAAASIQALSAEMQQFMNEYQWYQAQQMKLQQDYDKGVQILVSGGMPVPQQPQGGGQ